MKMGHEAPDTIFVDPFRDTMKYIISFIILSLCTFLVAETAYLGIYIKAPSPSELRGARLSHGIMVDSIVPGSPAEIYGLMRRDIIYQINDTVIRNERDLNAFMMGSKPNDIVTIYFTSNNRQFSRQITLTNRNMLYRELYIYNYIQNPWLFIGIQAEEISPQLSLLLNIEKGMVILSVRDKSIASQQGLEAGDIILSVNDALTTDERSLTHALNHGLAKQPMKFVLWRNSQSVTIMVDLSNDLRSGTKTSEIFIIGPDVFDNELYGYSREKINTLLRKSRSELADDIQRLELEIFRLRQALGE
jgi:S1-C subfamily serine protease